MNGVNKINGWYCLPGQRVSPHGQSFIGLHLTNGQVDALDYSDEETRVAERVADNNTQSSDNWIIGKNNLEQYLINFDEFYRKQGTNSVQKMAESQWGVCEWPEASTSSGESMTTQPRLKLANGWHHLDGKHLADSGSDLYYFAFHIIDGQIDALDCSYSSIADLNSQIARHGEGTPGDTWIKFLERVDARYKRDGLSSIRDLVIAQHKKLGKNIEVGNSSGAGAAVGFALLAAAGLAVLGQKRAIRSQTKPQKASEPATKKA